MRVWTVHTLLFIAALSVFAAEVTVGCGRQDYVYGTVTQKFTPAEEATYEIKVDGTPYVVPTNFYYEVQVGDLVKYDGKQWQVIKPNEPTFPSTTAPAPKTPLMP